MSVLVEGGGTLLGSLFDERLVDKVYAFVAPMIFGGRGRRPVGGLASPSPIDAVRLERVRQEAIGERHPRSSAIHGIPSERRTRAEGVVRPACRRRWGGKRVHRDSRRGRHGRRGGRQLR